MLSEAPEGNCPGSSADKIGRETSTCHDYTVEDESLDLSEDAATTPAIETDARAEDRRLVAAVLQKDRKATAEFVARYADQINRYVRSRLIPRVDLVDDLVQEVFLAAWENLVAYRGDSPLGAWLLGIARHKVEGYYRVCLRESCPLEEALQEAQLVVMEVDIDEILDRGRLRERTRRVLATMPEVYSLALLWRYWEKCSAQEMAIRTGKTVKAIERLLARAREMFRERWRND
jgi:RNA polymerase sigma-70 factor (ECF subfamily)